MAFTPEQVTAAKALRGFMDTLDVSEANELAHQELLNLIDRCIACGFTTYDEVEKASELRAGDEEGDDDGE